MAGFTDLPTLDDVELAERRAFLRLDLNVPLEDGRITSEARIRAVLPTIRHLLEAGAALVLSSHLGRPKGKRVPELSLEPVGARLSEILGVDVVLADDCVGDGVRRLVTQLRPGELLLLENLRYHAGEEANDPDLVRRMVQPFDLENDVYINDAFGASHRAHASIVGVASQFEHRAAGLLLHKEVQALGAVIDAPKRPFVAVIGGAKVADKLGILGALLDKVDTLCIGGAMAYTFLEAAGENIGASRCEEAQLAAARSFLDRAGKRGIQVILPSDHVVAESFAADAPHQTITERRIPDGRMGLDIGPATRRAMAQVIQPAGTVFWNGPVGVFEWEAFAAGSRAIAEAVAACRGHTVIGGGETVAAAESAGVTGRIGHVSTGGGASLEMIKNGTLPGIEVLRRKGR